jgi:DDE superfamily endonuclease
MDDGDDELSSLSSYSSSSSSSSSGEEDSDNELQSSFSSSSNSSEDDAIRAALIVSAQIRVNPMRLPIINSILLLTSWAMQVDMLMQEIASLREVRRPYVRRNWDDYWIYAMNDPSFEREIRMRRDSFVRLLSYVENDLLVDVGMANRRGGPISPALCLYMTIRYLTGDSYTSNAIFAGISPSSFYACLNKTMKAICNCPALAIVFPSTSEECEELAIGFQNVSEKDAIVNCVGCVDGYLLSIKVPPALDANNVKSFFSGHYKKYGINIQAVCDRNAMFTYFSLSAPGSSSDRVAVKEKIEGVSLFDKIQQLPEDYVILADAAYEPTNKLIPMFYGHQRDSQLNSNFNFAASSLRMRIEMAFGQMVSKFGILQRPLQNDLSNVKYVALSIAMLHNFCIRERIFGLSPWERENPQPFQYLRAVPNLVGMDERFPAPEPDENINAYTHSGYSAMRNKMALRVRQQGVVRPTCSVLHPNYIPAG